ncbi:MAG: hypothetical protein QF893_09555 [Alphaproteobacteria bacterium]|jgi:hypothetical protein|nr:hypothetical protein [Alphaproteobacteria bacterium]
MSDTGKPSLRQRIGDAARKAIHWGNNHIAPGVRSLLGLVLMVAGVFGFLPILGFWMIPLGLVLIALDIPPLRRRLTDWSHRR